ncbi:alkaline phosphatase [Bacillus songklensis]|uniref:Alkaline phosphatase n=1 Tax=Bacillus songklensis TaxID=1069116 RepID=A0ABV8B4L9_9BACI
MKKMKILIVAYLVVFSLLGCTANQDDEAMNGRDNNNEVRNVGYQRDNGDVREIRDNRNDGNQARVQGTNEARSRIAEAPDTQAQIKNVIFLIGDGMGVTYTSAYRYWKDNPDTATVERTEFDKNLVGNQMTYPEDPEQNVTDSAASGTAMSTGHKTYNAAIAVENDRTEIKTVLEAAKGKGKATGLVVTSELTHATPASFGAHDVDRKNMDSMANDYYDEMINGQHKIDVMLGGGRNNFVRSDRNLPEEFKKAGYSYVTNRQELLNNKNNRILGIFAPAGLPKMIDRTEEIPSLEEMTNAAISRLSKDKDGFFLMIEGSQIDWAGHDNDVVSAMSEMQDFEKSYKAAIEFAKKDKHTLVVATADHSTGGFSIGANGIYNWFPAPIKAAKRTPDFMANEIVNKGADIEATLKQYIGLELTAEEVKSVKDAAEQGKADKDKGLVKVDNAIESIFNKRSNTGWTTGGHTGEDVAVFAFGPGKERFAGQKDNTDHPKVIFDILK